MVQLGHLDPKEKPQNLSERKRANPGTVKTLGPIELSVSHPIAQLILALGIPGGIFYLLATGQPVPDALWAALGAIIAFFFVNGRLAQKE